MKTVLVVDDEPEFVALVKQRLEGRYTVLIALDGEAGLALAVEKKPDLILADILMPNKDGYQMVRELRRKPEMRDVPIVLLTSVAATSSLLDADELGATDYLIKPFEFDKLPDVIDHYIRTGPGP